jgi:exopolysaccharide biosynthesis polyprenyl glycosylphosphotransferase
MPIKHIQDQWLLFAGGFNTFAGNYYIRIKRLVDIFISIIGIIAFLPIFLIAAAAISLSSPGGVFFQQQRVGQDGKIFTLWKLRSMYQDAEANGPRWATPGDHRITRVGKWLRLARIDEVPQLWNVLCGDMSLIGPRPERPAFVDALVEIIPYYFIRHIMKPGLSGWAQVNYPYGSSIEDAKIKLEYELYYIKNASLWLDFKIILRTIGVMFTGQGAR